jgi:hypothetical protein
MLLAHVDSGNASASTANKSTRLITALLNPSSTVLTTAEVSGDRDLSKKAKYDWVTKESIYSAKSNQTARTLSFFHLRDSLGILNGHKLQTSAY